MSDSRTWTTIDNVKNELHCYTNWIVEDTEIIFFLWEYTLIVSADVKDKQMFRSQISFYLEGLKY